MSEDVYQERVRIPAEGGSLTGELAYALDGGRSACLLINPHPYMGGHMENPVIARLALELAMEGAVTLRFDYSGVGASDGPAVDVVAAMARFWGTGDSPQDPRMVEDVRSAAGWLRSRTGLPMVLVGYSFGAFAMQAALADDVQALIVLSPTIRHHDFAAIAAASVPKLVIHGDDDFAATADELTAWVAGVAGPKVVHRVPGGQHFFRACEQEVAEVCRGFVRKVMSATEAAA